MSVARIAVISEAPLDVAAHLAAVEDPALGAVTTFVGRVRDHDPDAAGPVVALEYSAHPDAAETLRQLAERTAASIAAVVAVSHRVGRTGVGDDAVVIAVAPGHPAAQFLVRRALIAALTKGLPVWAQIGRALARGWRY